MVEDQTPEVTPTTNEQAAPPPASQDAAGEAAAAEPVRAQAPDAPAEGQPRSPVEGAPRPPRFNQPAGSVPFRRPAPIRPIGPAPTGGQGQPGPAGEGVDQGQGQRPYPPRPGGFRPPQQGQGGQPVQGGQQGPGGRWVDLGSKPGVPRPLNTPPGSPTPAPTGNFGPPRPRPTGVPFNGYVGLPTGPARPPTPAGAPGSIPPRPGAPRPWTPRPAGGAPFGAAPAAGARPGAKDWLRSKNESRRGRGADKKKKDRVPAPADGAAKGAAPLMGRPKPVALRPKGETGPAITRALRATMEAGDPDRIVQLPRVITVKDLAETLDVNAVEVIKSLMQNGIMASINQIIDYDTAEIIAGDLGVEVKPEVGAVDEEATDEEKADAVPLRKRVLEGDEGHLQTRPPVVTIMGHVDHGKTSLLDAIRQTNVAGGEAGAITQHIGAYQVEKNDHKITFLDTPGHEAFTAMRARGAQATDIAILVVAADDGVQPQTLEALNHARAAQVPIIVALNKIDKEGANPDRVKQQLADAGLMVEDWGGDTVVVPVSAKKKLGIDQLLEMILLVADMQDLKANPDRAGVGVIVEAQLDKAKGPLATVLVQHGTLNLGDNVLVGEIFGKVKAMFNDKGKRIRKAEPATPAGVLGLPEVPRAGDIIEVMADEKTARALAMDRQEKRQRSEAGATSKVSLDDLFAQIQAGTVKDLNIILKADVQGSVEPIVNSLNRLGDEKVKVKVIHTGIGAIRESDISLAVASKAIVVGFNEQMDPAAKHVADTEGIDVRYYQVIYNLIDDVQKAMQGLYEPKYQDVLEGKAEVRTVFKVGKTGAVAGCFVLEGPITRSSTARVVRDGTTLFTGKIAGLRRFKDDVREVERGYECGLSLDGFNDLQENDIIETYRRERVS